MQPVPSPPPAVASPVEAARARLSGIDALSTVDQVEAYDAVHRLLQDALAAVEHDLRSDGHGAQPVAPGPPGRARHTSSTARTSTVVADMAWR